MAKHLYIMRGFPGCGKSFRASEVAGGDLKNIFSADNYFMKDGVYTFDTEKLWLAHKQCRALSFAAMQSGQETVVIDNTNVKARDFKPYVMEGVRNGYHVSLAYPTSEWWLRTERLLKNKEDNWDRLLPVADLLAAKNVHGVPREVIISMMEKWQFVESLPLLIERWQAEPVTPE